MKKEILSKLQLVFLEKVKSNQFITDHFYLRGGTALAVFYLGHRYSEDLDFFSEKEFDILTIDVFVKSIRQELGVASVDFQQSYNRNIFFLKLADGGVLKTEFSFYPFLRLEKGTEDGRLIIDSLLDIAVNKLFTIYQRSQARDYIDLYYICQEKNLSIGDLITKARLKFDWQIDPLQLGTQFMRVAEVKDYPRMIAKMEVKEWQDFFLEEAKKLKPEIIQ